MAAGKTEVDLLLSSATAEGFSGGLYVGFPHKGLAKKYFLCLLKKGSSPMCEGQMWSQACPLALPLHCELPAAACHVLLAYLPDCERMCAGCCAALTALCSNISCLKLHL